LGDLGFAGLRVHYALNTPSYKDELVAFLDATYFRALGQGQRYGMSARAIAIDTVGPRARSFRALSSSGCSALRPGEVARHPRAARFAAGGRRLPVHV